LLAELDQVRRHGPATNDEELESALRSIAASQQAPHAPKTSPLCLSDPARHTPRSSKLSTHVGLSA
jgi:hypothetical protein